MAKTQQTVSITLHIKLKAANVRYLLENVIDLAASAAEDDDGSAIYDLDTKKIINLGLLTEFEIAEALKLPLEIEYSDLGDMDIDVPGEQALAKLLLPRLLATDLFKKQLVKTKKQQAASDLAILMRYAEQLGYKVTKE